MGYALDQLGSVRCREIAEGLFTVSRVYGAKLNGCCPVREEKNPSFFYNFERDVASCSSCGWGGDLVKLWSAVTGRDFLAFKSEFVGENAPVGGSAPKKKSKPVESSAPPAVFVPEEDLEALEPLSTARVDELVALRQWSADTMLKLDLRSYVDFKGCERVAIPIRDNDGRLCNIRLYLPGAKEFKVISWSDPKCRACGGEFVFDKAKKKKRCKGCASEPTSYGSTRLWPPPADWRRSEALWLCEGEPDTICMLSKGYNATTQTAGARTFPKAFAAPMKGLDVLVLFDADQPGYEGAIKAAQEIALHAKSVRVVVWPEGFVRG